MLKKVEKLFKSFQGKQTPKGRFEPQPFRWRANTLTTRPLLVKIIERLKIKLNKHKLNLKTDSLSKFIRLENKQI